MTEIVWFSRDLRVADHPALAAASASGEPLAAVFCLDDRLLHGRHASGTRTGFLLESLAELEASLRRLGSGLLIRHGPPERELAALAAKTGARRVHATADITPFARRRAERVREPLARAGAELVFHPGLTAVDDVGELRARGGRPYRVFTPFSRAWLEADRRPVIETPRALAPPPDGIEAGRIPSLADLGLRAEAPEAAPGGEAAGREAVARFLDGPVDGYGERRDDLAAGGTSRLSPYLRFGCVSPRELEHELPAGEGAEAYRRQLCWREFHHHVLLHHPANAREEMQERYRGAIRWSHEREPFEAWCAGRTGYPLVDAGMRQLRREGWMHNRARLVAGSFLTKHLGIDWRWGERWFMRMLVDGDEANNNGNWQWIASVGSDPAPAFRRILSPTRQLERFDPSGAYVRRNVPELRRVPDSHLAEPWGMSDEVQRRAGCVIGVDYPEPIVDNAEARAEALERYREAGERRRAA